MADTQYMGVAPLTLVKTNGGASAVYVYAHQPVPAGADADDVKRLVDEGYLAKLGGDGPVASQPEGGPALPPGKSPAAKSGS